MKLVLLMCRVAHNEATLTAHGETTSRVIKASTQDSATQILLQIKCKFYLKTHTRKKSYVQPGRNTIKTVGL